MRLSSARRRCCGQCRNYRRSAQLSEACGGTLNKLRAANGSHLFASMARGHQKIQSQQKNAKKQAEIKKSKGHDQKTAAKAALVFTCGVCRVSVANARSQALQAAF
ncbi:zinc finger protein 706-like isoform X2 [Sinocyclocheilus anshuiensis]|uniref:zinc finger protein 706-like isoform X2 n=1 Tax=Sinocyclocheilus anshuiensis TaxID=1608454 RepID=UPI0007BAB6BE|nr:PREDICTED: zinc finger protein 706-like isoform X2 [Sinocyclocheilus anshuiensis]